jgi:hypothetical protein
MVGRKLIAAFVLGLVASPAFADGVEQENLDEYGKGIITDYTDMTQSEPVEWIWVAPGTKLSGHRFQFAPARNLAKITDADMEETVDHALPRTLDRVGAKDAGAPLLQVESAIFWADRANRSKLWIPYAGLHLAQAGVGIELVFRNAQGEVVAKVRHSGREGDDLENAAEELIDDLGDFVRNH